MHTPLRRGIKAVLAAATMLAAVGCSTKKEDGKVTITVDTEQIEEETREAVHRTGKGLEKVGKRIQEGTPRPATP